MGMDELSEEDKRTVSRARKVQRFQMCIRDRLWSVQVHEWAAMAPLPMWAPA